MTTGIRYRVRTVWRHVREPIVSGDVVFDPNADPASADALLVCGGPSDELLEYRGVKAWWAFEALSHSVYRTPLARRALGSLGLSEWLHFDHPDPRYTVPIFTHFSDSVVEPSASRKPRAVAIVSNTGGPWWWMKPGLRARNRFILEPCVDLFGSRENWRRFRRGLFSRPACPANYAGEMAGWNMCRDTILGIAAYKAAVCLENTCEPRYFTEKFVQAVQACAVPVYHAHPSVRDGLLRGAAWVDPAEHGFDPARTIEAALRADPARFVEPNVRWLRSEPVAATRYDRAFDRVAAILRGRLERGAAGPAEPRVLDAVSFRRWTQS